MTPEVKVHRNGQSLVISASYQPIPWLIAEYDPMKMVNPYGISQIIIPLDGMYLMGCQAAARFAESDVGMEFGLAVNGNYVAAMTIMPSTGIPLVTRCPLHAADVVQMLVTISGGVPRTLLAAGSLYPYLWLARVGDLPDGRVMV